MLIKIFILLFIFKLTFASDVCEFDDEDNPVRFQLDKFRQCYNKPLGLLTTSAGDPVDITDTNSLNTNLLFNRYFLDSIIHEVSERIPERIVHAKGVGALGYFEVTNDVSHICSADVFNGVGKKTPLAMRFSPSVQGLGGSDLAYESRGCGIKFYTEEGNLDIVGFNTPVYFYKDPVIFLPLVRATKPNPATNLLDPTAQWDFITLRPENLHEFLWIKSDFGMPNGYRHMPCFGIHGYEVVNKHGESFFVKFNFTTDQGIENLSNEEAARIRAVDPSYYLRDMYNEIGKKNYPSWTLYMDIMTKEDLKKVDFDPFDVTRIWKKGTYTTLPVGRIVLNENPKNFFAQIEQLALNPSNLVPGIVGPPDKLFQSRIIAYREAQNRRLGFNHNNIVINRPKYAKTYNRDGQPPVLSNMKDIPNYYPNSFNGPVPTIDTTRPAKRLEIWESSAVDLEPASNFYTDILDEGQRTRLVANLANEIALTVPYVRERTLKLLKLTNTDLGRRVAAGVRVANTTLPTPTVVLPAVL